LEILGIFDPLKDAGLPELKQERVLSWLHQGAQPTVTVKTLLRRSGIWKQFETEKAAKTTAKGPKTVKKTVKKRGA
jgi:small subunit ribosomal protein S16